MGYTREQNEIRQILKAHGAVLERTKKHHCWRFPDGSTWVHSSSPSDVHAWANALRDLKNKLNLNGMRGMPGERRPKRVKSRKAQVTRWNENAASVEIRDLSSQLAAIAGSSSQRMSPEGSSGAERSPSKAEIIGSTPISPTIWNKTYHWLRAALERLIR